MQQQKKQKTKKLLITILTTVAESQIWHKKLYLSVSCFDTLGGEIVNSSVRCPNSFGITLFSAFSLVEDEQSWCTFIAESNPAVIRREELGSYEHRHIPLPLNNHYALCKYQTGKMSKVQ